MRAVLFIVALVCSQATTKSCQTDPVNPSGVGGSPGTGGSVVVDAGPAPVDECAPKVLDACGLAGERLCRLGCRDKAGQPLWRTPEGGTGSFAAACRAAQDDGRNWRPDCLSKIADCSQLEAAYRTKAGATCAH